MGASAEEPERNTSPGIFYDEILRKQVENKCGQLGADWEYASMFAQVDECILRKARRCPPFLFVLVRVHSRLVHLVVREFDEAHKKPVHVQPKGSAGGGARVSSAAAAMAATARLKDAALWSAQPTTPKGEKRNADNHEAGGKKQKKVKCWRCGEVGHYASQCPKSS